MTYHDRNGAADIGPTLADVLAWGEAAGEDYHALCELRKAPARLGLTDGDLALLPADMGYFERTIAPSSYAAVSRSRNIDAARRRGNARLRALLIRYAEAREPRASDDQGRADWDALIAWVEERSSPPGRGGRFQTGTARALYMLRARSGCAPQDLTQADVDRIAREVHADRRKSLRKGLRLLERLRQERENEIAGLLPVPVLTLPAGVARLPKRAWASLPGPFRLSAEAAIDRSISSYADHAADARRRLAAGEDPEAVRAAFNKAKVKQVRNSEAARTCYRGAISWLLHAYEASGGRVSHLADLRDVFSIDRLESAVAWQIERTRRSPHHRNPEHSQTLHTYLTHLKLLAERGLGDPALVLAVELAYHDAKGSMRTPGRTPGDELSRFCRLVQSSPRVARAIVNAPAEIYRVAQERLAQAKAKPARELTALRLAMAAAMAAVQMSRPLRTGSLRYARCEHAGTLASHFRRVQDRFVAHFPAGEIKNAIETEFEVAGEDARILREWLTVHRARYIALRRLPPSPYLFPGESMPRHVKNGLHLPVGCMSPGSFDIVWRDAMDAIGVRMTIHQCRHAIATLILAMYPGDYGRAAAVLGDDPETVRKHYGRDDAKAAARFVREALLATHPDLEARFAGRRA